MRREDDRVVMHAAAGGRQPDPTLPEQNQRHQSPTEGRRGRRSAQSGTESALYVKSQDYAGRETRGDTYQLQNSCVVQAVAPPAARPPSWEDNVISSETRFTIARLRNRKLEKASSHSET
jgi:hypothetical protein